MTESLLHDPIIDIESLLPYQQEALCRTIIGSIRRHQNEQTRREFEEWRKNYHKGEKTA